MTDTTIVLPLSWDARPSRLVLHKAANNEVGWHCTHYERRRVNFAVGAGIASWGEDEKRIVAKRWRKSGKFRKCTWITCSWEMRRKGRRWHSFCKRKGDESCAQYGGSVEDDGRMAWLREIGLESVDIIVKSDNEPALTSLIALWSTMRAMTSGSRMIIENSPVGSSKSNGIVERAIQSVQGMIRTIRSDIEGRWGVKIDATHSIWPWIAEHAGFLLTRFEVGRDGKTAYERLKGKSAKVQGMAFAEGMWWKRKRAGGPLGKLTCMWKDGIYLGVKATTAEIIVGNRNGVCLTRTVRRKPAKERWDRSSLEMVVAVPWRKNEDDPKMDGERLKSEVVVMDKEYRE